MLAKRDSRRITYGVGGALLIGCMLYAAVVGNLISWVASDAFADSNQFASP